MNKYRTHNCSELSEKEINKKVHLSGWLHRKRDHGNLLFIDLRDHYGMTQCVIENKNKFFPVLEKLKPESVLKISGKVIKRSSETENLDLKTGKIEISIEQKSVVCEEIEFNFSIDDFSQNRILNGIDKIDISLEFEEKIDEFMQSRNKWAPKLT